MIELGEHEHIVTAFAESASGPGWTNRQLWVIVQDASGQLRRKCIQPTEQTGGMAVLYRVSEAAHLEMTREIESAVAERSASAPEGG